MRGNGAGKAQPDVVQTTIEKYFFIAARRDYDTLARHCICRQWNESSLLACV
jgi:hypothetical protein